MSSGVRFIDEEVREKNFVLILHFNSGKRQEIRLPRSEALMLLQDHFHTGISIGMYTSESQLHLITHTVIEHIEVRTTKPHSLRQLINDP